MLVAIDPGLTGGIAYIEGFRVTGTRPMPVGVKGSNAIDVRALEALLRPASQVVLETPIALTRGRAGSTVATMFTNYGRIVGVLEYLRVPYFTLTPHQIRKGMNATAVWQKEDTAAWVEAQSPGFTRPLTPRGRLRDGECDAAAIGLVFARLAASGGIGAFDSAAPDSDARRGGSASARVRKPVSQDQARRSGRSSALGRV